MPEMSGLPSVVFGAGPFMSTLPSAVRGAFGVFTSRHCALQFNAPAANKAIANRVRIDLWSPYVFGSCWSIILHRFEGRAKLNAHVVCPVARGAVTDLADQGCPLAADADLENCSQWHRYRRTKLRTMG